MLITPNYSAISVLHEGEPRPFAEGEGLERERNRLKETKETISQVGFI